MKTVGRFALALVLGLAGVTQAQVHQGKTLVEAALVADRTAVSPGGTFKAGLHLRLAEGWHVYAEDPGDSGIPTRIEWTLPKGVAAGKIEWPPHRVIVEPGDIRVNGYKGEVLLPVPIRVDPGFSGKEIRLKAKAAWLVCEDICIPGQAELELVVPVSDAGEPANTDLFERFSGLPPPGKSAGGLWLHLLLGFIGGLILNIMPCVLPVIGLKIMGFVHQAGATRLRVFQLGLAFCAGIFAFFLGIATLATALRAAGSELNWAFQFQNPWFVGIMAAVLLAFGLSLLGAFEILLPPSLNHRIYGMAASEGLGGAFGHGLFATLLATPCTAPFLGPALGYALAQPAPVVFAVFACVAAGMASPYFVLTARPAWLKLLPKPGAWMDRTKRFFGILLLLSAVWLGWVLWRQIAPQPGREPFAPQLERALATGKTVFVDFTADWCVNCKVNERLILKTERVRQLFREHDVAFLVADWTRGDDDITALLRSFGRAGVPLYVIYPRCGGTPVVLPEVITAGMIEEVLNKIRRDAVSAITPAPGGIGSGASGRATSNESSTSNNSSTP